MSLYFNAVFCSSDRTSMQSTTGGTLCCVHPTPGLAPWGRLILTRVFAFCSKHPAFVTQHSQLHFIT